MRISVLGPLEVVHLNAIITPTAAKLRQVLALLALHSGRVVRNEQILEELWEDNPPVSVTTTMQTYIYQLRKLLRLQRTGLPTSEEYDTRPLPSLQTSPGGYSLNYEPECLDAYRFEQLVNQGRLESSAGRWTDAAATLTHAGLLWRGPALADVNVGPVLHAEILRLDEFRRNALELRLEADLRLGRHHELIGELARLVGQEPTNESLQSKLIIALHRAGRRAEALRVYQQLRTALNQELGLDPSEELQRLHRAVLDADSSLDLPLDDEVQRVTLVEPQCQLPPRHNNLVSRDEPRSVALAALRAGESSGPATVVVTGPPASGKSAFAIDIAHSVRHQYPDGQLYARLIDDDGNPVDKNEILGHFLRALDNQHPDLPSGTHDRMLRFRSLTSDRRLLTVFEDVTNLDQLTGLMPSGDDCAVIVISRRRLAPSPSATVIELSPLDLEQSGVLLAGCLGRDKDGTPAAADKELLRLCDGLPGALETVANRLKVRPHWTPARTVRWIKAELARDGGATSDPLGLRAGVWQSYLCLTPPGRAAFRIVTEAPTGSVSTAELAARLSVPEYIAETILDELAELCLVTIQEDDSSSCHCLPCIRAVGHQLIEEHTRLSEMLTEGTEDTFDIPAQERFRLQYAQRAH
ncbi:AfsR/SARP family transcriptional regulator [Amycolatopsis regifaucium]|uniref:AfsR/SARP family transcriptional regulator n=1 Tax=Amycolatopsis regifaucium TaxID=546365 RepID=UPI001471FE08|nr:AfsR/SARP family transcriptional regulator [Amycolatopsis regifaucium]